MRHVQRVHHTEEQIGWIEELFLSPGAGFMARNAEIEVIEHGGRSQTVLREFSSSKPSEIFIRHSPAALQSRCVVLHEFAHYYALYHWPELTPPRTPEKVCEAAAFIPHWRALAGHSTMWIGDILKYLNIMMQDARPWVREAVTMAYTYERTYAYTSVEGAMESLLANETP